MQKSPHSARAAWTLILDRLTLTETSDQFERVRNLLSVAPSDLVYKVQGVLLTAGWADEGYEATGNYDERRDLPQLLRLYGAAGGSIAREAKITIGSVELNNAQSMAVRVAVSSMLMELQDQEHRKALGDIAELYEARLQEVQTIILGSAY